MLREWSSWSNNADHTAPCPYRPTDAPVGTPRSAGRPQRGGCAGPLCHGAGAWSGGRPHCAGLARGSERRGNRERGRQAPGGRFRDPKKMRAAPLILIVMQDPGVVCPCTLLLLCVWCVVCDTLENPVSTQHVTMCTFKTSPCVASYPNVRYILASSFFCLP